MECLYLINSRKRRNVLKVLTQSLNDLIEINILYKRGKASTGHKTYYGLTPLGKRLLPLIHQIKEWIRENKDELEN